MKLLVVTQTVDENDAVLGFFCRWLAEFALHAERIEVICLKEGEHHLPANVRVHSLGKEHGRQSRLIYAWRFKWLIWQLRGDYDTVFVHMNPEYMILGGIFWKLSGKRVFFWYNHPQDDLKLRLALPFAHRVFYTSAYAASARSPKSMRMPVGIDTELFSPQPVTRDRSAIYIQGRIMPSKRVHVLLEALRILRAGGTAATLTIVGPEDPVYGAKLRSDFSDLIQNNAVVFAGPRKNEGTPDLYRKHGVAINLAAAGHFDKTGFEPMACETPVVLSSKAFTGIVPPEWIIPENDAAALAAALRKMIMLPEGEYRALGAAERAAVVREHSLTALAEKLFREFAKRPAPRASLLKRAVWGLLYAFTKFIPARPRMTVLMYHGVNDSGDFFSVSPREFEKQLRYLSAHADVITLADLLEHVNGKPLPRDAVALTFDDGYADFRDEVVPLVERAQVPGAVFLLAGVVDRKELANDAPLLTLADAAKLSPPYVAVESHGLTHRKITRMPREEALRELADSRAAIEEATGRAPEFFAYPKGSYNDEAKELAKQAGYAAAFTAVATSVPKRADAYALPRIQIDGTTSFIELKAKLTTAADWYYRLWKRLR